jgi:glycosyltransferase involved in cell wall biosynthesis
VTLLKVLKDKALREHLGEQGLLKAGQYSWERVSQQVEEFYREVLARRSR